MVEVTEKGMHLAQGLSRREDFREVSETEWAED